MSSPTPRRPGAFRRLFGRSADAPAGGAGSDGSGLEAVEVPEQRAPEEPIPPAPGAPPVSPAPELVGTAPSIEPDAPVQPLPEAPVPPTPEVIPDAPVSPAPGGVPDAPVSPAPGGVPDAPVSPAPGGVPDAPVSPAPGGVPDAPVSPAPAGPMPDEPPPLIPSTTIGDEVAAELAAQTPDAEPAPRPVEAGEWRGVVLVTGTDTDVGKTIVTSAIAAAAAAAGLRVAVIKPGQTGTANGAPTDIDLVTRLAAPATARTLASYPDPLAPLAAARVAHLAPLELYEVVDAVRAESARHDLVLVEGAGGLLVPMGVRPSGEAWTLADLATTLGVSAIVVSRAGLGTLNHTALTLEALSRRGIPAGVVLGAWPAEPELVHWANFSELLPHLVGALPDGAGAMEPGVFRRSAPGWLTPALYGVLDDWRVWTDEVS